MLIASSLCHVFPGEPLPMQAILQPATQLHNSTTAAQLILPELVYINLSGCEWVVQYDVEYTEPSIGSKTNKQALRFRTVLES